MFVLWRTSNRRVPIAPARKWSGGGTLSASM